MSASKRRLDALRDVVPEVSPSEALARQARGAILIDVREADEMAGGVPTGALRLGRGFLELRIEEAVPDPDTPVLTLCAGGVRSLFAAESLRQMGYTDVRSVAGGFAAWKREQLPIETPRVLSIEERERYGRHLTIPEVGEEGQAKLLDSKVLLVGAGGLGSPAAYYLAAAGVGTLGIVDDDVVDRSNLQRQILHADDSSNVDEIFSEYDLVLDGADNFPTRYLVNDACVKLGLPVVHGSVFRFEGQISVFWPSRPEAPGPCYRCLYPTPPPPELAPSCAEAGVLGVLPGVVGLLQAVEAVKVLLDIGEPLVGRLVQYDALEQRFTKLKLERNPDCTHCADGRDFPGYEDLQFACRAVG
jgi:molybdopterin/thiamine biosynthesis adenylyltransferase/rhodanese-related sulfurtransferase